MQKDDLVAEPVPTGPTELGAAPVLQMRGAPTS